MSDKFNPYREALVVETATDWPKQCAHLDSQWRKAIEQRLHADPSAAANFHYVRLPTGFCRRISVKAEDLARLEENQ